MEFLGHPVRIERADRKSIGLIVEPDGTIRIRAPQGAGERDIRSALETKRAWLERALARMTASREAAAGNELTPEEIRALTEKALRVIPPKVAFYAARLGVTYGKITIRCQKTRWGSCSSSGNLNFNCLLMLAPDEVTDSVIVHELCHRFEMNHSARFYARLRRVYPDYDRCHAWLEKNGGALLRRAGKTG